MSVRKLLTRCAPQAENDELRMEIAELQRTVAERVAEMEHVAQAVARAVPEVNFPNSYVER